MLKIENWREIKGSKGKIILIIGVIGLLLITGISYLITPTKGYAVKIDNKEIGIIAEKKILDNVLEELRTAKAEETGLTIKDTVNQVVAEDIEGYRKEPLTKDALKTALQNQLDWMIEAVGININGEFKAYLASQSAADEVINRLKEEYIEGPEGEELLAADFEEDVKVTVADVGLGQLTDPERAVTLILNGTDKIETYKVRKGDTLWDIAHANNMTVTELKEANPQLEKDVLSIDQELKLVKSEPMVHIVTEVQYTTEEKIPFDTKYISSSDLWRGQSRVETPGENGEQKVTYKVTEKNGVEVNREILEKVVLAEPMTKVVYQGTKVMVASRGGGGEGKLAWPLRGRITSGYGWRRLGFHTGIDIDGVTGDPVFAAEAGAVISAGWKGSYGYCIDIDHGDGLLTRYAHLSKIDVKMAQQVKRGDYIGRVGTTGNSTGSHLHFEVRVNGDHTNPLKYLD
ncbi:MAG: peptidoglycan DD-metalloendopeptidase family protein [Peptococcaceae bacterium]